MNITNKSPVYVDFTPIPKSVLTLKFKLKGLKEKLKIDVGVTILHKDPSIDDRIFLLNPGLQNVFTNIDDRMHTLKFDLTDFNSNSKNILSYMRMSIGNKDNINHEVKIDCAKITQTNKIDTITEMLIPKEKKNLCETKEEKDLLENKDKNELGNILNETQEIISPQAAMVVQHTKANALRSTPWTLMTTKVEGGKFNQRKC
jgi:hypothetical protein